MAPPRPSLSLVLPLASAALAAAILWGGGTLARQERTERIPRTGAGGFAEQLQGRLAGLESQYERHLARICRTDLDHSFGVRDAVDGVIGVRQLSTLDPEGRIDLHLPASDVETTADLAIPVLDPRERPPGREHFAVLDSSALFGGGEGESGWTETPEGLFFFQRVADRRVVLLLVDPRPAEAAMAEALAPWIAEKLVAPASGADRVFLGERSLAAAGEPDTAPPDVVRTLASRFGSWQVRSWDGRKTIVTWRRDRLAIAGGLAGLVLLTGIFAGISLRRALRLAEQRVSFVNRVSHELKTPLTNILLNADLAADGVDPRRRQRLDRVREETRRLARLIDNVLAFSRRGRVGSKPRGGLEPVALRPLVEEAVEVFAPSLERKDIAVEFEADEADGTIHASIEPDALRQILGNLISNIEKYAAVGKAARIRLLRDGGEAVVLVSDDGPGIPKREGERVFEPFHRLDNRTRAGITGTGLGLAIARDLAGEAGGSLRLVAGTGRGATFALRLPAAPAPVARVIAFPGSRAS